MVKDTKKQSCTSSLREFNPFADRSLYQQRIVDAIFAEFETHEMCQEEFCEAMWMLCRSFAAHGWPRRLWFVAN